MYGNVHIPPKGTTLADVTIVVLGGRTRRSCVLAAAFLALFAASGARAVDPELRDAMKASVPAVPQKHAKRVESRTTDRDRAQADWGARRTPPPPGRAPLHFQTARRARPACARRRPGLKPARAEVAQPRG